MPEEILASYPGFELWGLNRKTPCVIALSDHRLIVAKAEGRSDLPEVKPSTKVDDLLRENHYSLPFETIRYLDSRIQLGGVLFKLYTTGGSYRFRLKRKVSQELETRLREILGDRLTRPKE